MDSLELRAMAKINLGLDVVGRREDGYHLLRMIMQSVRLYDRITLTREPESGVRLQTNLSYVPTDGTNLASRAAQTLIDEFGIKSGVTIRLEKKIPVAAGLAGGSSDAAAVLVGMNRLFSLGLSRRELCERGVKLGADIPFCVVRGTCLAEGIGEELTELPALPPCTIVIAKPAVRVSTKNVYQKIDSICDIAHPDVYGQAEALRNGDLREVCRLAGNVLELVTAAAEPAVGQLRESMKSRGAILSMMSGSGPSVFGIFEGKAEAESAAAMIRKNFPGCQVFVTGAFQSGTARR